MEKIDKTKLSDQTKLRIDKIKKIENYFNLEIIKENYLVKA